MHVFLDFYDFLEERRDFKYTNFFCFLRYPNQTHRIGILHIMTEVGSNGSTITADGSSR